MKNLLQHFLTRTGIRLLFFLFLIQSTSIYSAISYNFSASSGTFTANSAPTPIWTTNSDDNLSGAINIGFTFNFGGCTSTAYTQVEVSTNGWMVLGTGATGSQSSNDISWTSYGPLLAPLWDDLKTGASDASVNYKTTGAVGSRIFTVEWLKMKWGWGAGSEGISFQVKLYEVDGKIEFIYNQDAGALSSPSASIGINGGAAGDYYSLDATSASPSAVYGTATNNLSSKPANGQVYTWIPSTPMTYTSSNVFQASTADVYTGTNNNAITGIQVVVNGGCTPFNLTQMIINMTGTTSTADVTNIDVYYTGNSSIYSVSTLFGSVVPASGNLTINGSQTLLNGSNYFWIVYDVSSGATINDLLDAECTQITMDSGVGNKIPTGNPPAGSRPIADAPPSFSKWIELGWAKAVIQSSDGNIVWAGNTNNTYSSGNSDAYIVKTSSDLSTVYWTSVIGTTATESLEKIVETADGFVAVGKSNQFGGAGVYDMFVTKINLSGVEQWSRTIGSTGNDYGYGITKTSDGNVVVIGTYDDGGTDTDGLFAKMQNSDGSVLVQKGIDISASSCYLYSIIQTADGGFLMGGSRGVNTDFAMIKLKSDYTFDWGHYWGGGSGERISYVLENAANDYTIGGYTYSYGAGSKDGYMMRITVSGGIPTATWVNAYGSTENDSFNDGIRKSDGSYAMTGITSRAADPLNDEAYIVTTTSSGEVNIIKSIGSSTTSEDQEGYGIAALSDGSFAMAGLHNAANGSNYYMMKVSSSGYSCSSIQDNGSKTSLANPTFTSTGSVGSTFGVSTTSQAMSSGTGGVIANDGCVTNSVLLPIQLIEFKGRTEERYNHLIWSTASEINNDYFTLERSYNAIDWENIATIQGAGTTNDLITYNQNDYLPYSGINYYRLIQTDFDGHQTYSNLISLFQHDNATVFGTLFPNPASDHVTFDYQLERTDSPVTIELFNVTGEKINHEEFKPVILKGKFTFRTNELQSGIYFVHISQNDYTTTQKLFIQSKN